MANDVLLDEVRRRAIGTPDLVKLIAFGSRARGDARDDSDVDLIAVMTGAAPRSERAWQLRRRLLDLPVGVDLAVYSPDEYEKLRGWRSTLVALLVGAALAGRGRRRRSGRFSGSGQAWP